MKLMLDDGFTELAATKIKVNRSKDDLPDRVDFVYTAGKSKILESLIMGEPDTLLQVWFDH